MMDFITVPLTTGIVFAAIYGLFELLIRRKERMAIIEKLGDKLDASAFEGKMCLPSYGGIRFSFSVLKAGCLLTGIGLGVLAGFFLSLIMAAGRDQFDFYNEYQVVSTAYGAPILLFGGLGLIIAFVIEMKMSKDKKE